MSISFHHRQTSFQLIKTLLATILSWPNTAVKSGSGYERAIQEHILLRAPYNNKYSVTTTPFLHEKMLKICCRCFKNILNNIGHFCKYFLFGYQGNGQCICIIITTNNNYKIIQIHTLLILL